VERSIALPTGNVVVTELGSGPPLVVLHRDVTAPGTSPFLEALGERHTVFAPHLPGFGGSDRPEWMRSVAQLGVVTARILDALEVCPCPVVGLGFGGWVAADVATLGGKRMDALVLVSPLGIKPSSGEITDYALLSVTEYASLGFHDPASYVALCGEDPTEEVLRAWDGAREMVTRIAWKPIGHSRALPPMLGFAEVPALVVWGEEDAIVPRAAAQDWLEALPHATSVLLPDIGHQVDLEAPTELASLVSEFLAKQTANSTTNSR
jgi:pimeloyl-ACP methyl ester carboxylesterase